MKTYFFALALFAGQALAGPIDIGHPHSYPTPAPGVPGVGFFTISNTGKKADRLLSVSSPLAASVEIHRSEIKAGVMQMRAVPEGVLLPAGTTVSFAPGGLHLMLFEPRRPFAEGDVVPVVLHFEQAGALSVDLRVEARDTPADEHHHDHAH